ncbi:outer membrane protein [Legionella cardiaca]|uniref:Outer membrane beta-barrel protein n=1 Tax=Legionella cardiaca TaxID=1071983 RepID=A0ABY8AWF7_9GAMM|nr:outer membrane beta-barrel protein [Legionella cardiaca]WED44056.1 outer membrane beta-barrel protein [Legionella cardiaca]
MNKYSMLIIGLGLLPLTANANWYGAINLGVNAVNIEKDLAYPLGDPFLTSENFHSGYTNFHGQLAAGYDFLFTDKFGLNLEGNADLFTGKAEHTIHNWFFLDSVQTEEKLDYGFSLFALPEYHYHENVRFFVGPGVSRSRFKISSENTAGNAGVTGNFREWLTGWGLKAGVANQLTPNTEILFTYQFTQYDDATWTNVEPLSGASLSGRYKPEANLFMVGLRVSMPEFQKIQEK